MSTPGVLDLSLASYAVLVGRAGVDPDAEVARFDGTDSSVVYEGSAGWKFAGQEMDAAWEQSWEAQARLEREFLNDGLGVYDRAAHEAMLPAGFRDAGAEMGLIGHRLGAVGTSLSWESAQARNRLVELHAAVESRARVWESRVAEAGLIAPDQVDEWLTARDDVERLIVGFIVAGFDSVRGNVTRYEGVVGSALAGLAEQGFTDPTDSPGGSPTDPVAAPVGDPVLLAGLGTPVQAGFAADPVNTAIGNFVEAEPDLPFSGVVAGLGWSRTYNSRAPEGAGGLGSGWACWADARLRADDVAAYYVGPDGQRFTIARRPGGEGFVRVPDLAARLHPGEGGGLVLVWADGRRWVFDPTGRPASISHGPGSEVVFTFDEWGRLAELFHPGSGARLGVSWAGTWITAVTASDGRTVQYRYDDAGHLIEADAPAGPRRYRVDEAGLVSAVLDADGVAEVVNTYDELGRVIGQLSPHGRRTLFDYQQDPAGEPVTVVTDETGGPVNTYHHDPAGRLVSVTDGHGHTLRKRHDQWGQPVQVTRRGGGATHRSFDAQGRVTRQRSPSGAVTVYQRDDLGRVTSVTVSGPGLADAVTRLRYPGAELLPSVVIDPEGGRTRLDVTDGVVHAVTDPDGVSSRFRNDRFGRLIATTDTAGGVLRIDRDPVGRVTATTTPAGHRTTLTYDDRGRPTERRDPDGAVWRREFSPAGRLIATTDPTGVRTSTGYDRAGHLTTVHDGVADTRIDRDPLGRPITIHHPDGTTTATTYDRCGRPLTRTGPDGAVTTYSYSPAGRLHSVTSPEGRTEHYDYDECGRLATIIDGNEARWEHRYDPDGQLVARTSPAGLTETLEHDPCGRPTRHHIPGHTTTTWAYDRAGRITTLTDRAGRRSFTHDSLGRVTTTVDALGHTTTHTYDDHTTTITDPLGGITRYGHDELGRTTTVTDPLGRTATLGYDPAGRLTHSTGPDGHRTTWTHDPTGRIATVTVWDDTTCSIDRDLRGRPVHITEKGPSAATPVTLTWDPAGRLTHREAAGRTVEWAYDRDGLRTTLTHPDRTPTTYQRDPAGRVTTITHPLLGPITYDRDPDGRITTITGAGAGITRTHTDGWLTRHTTTLGTRHTTTTLTRDDHGRTTTTHTNGHTRHYSHDPAGQLTTTTDPAGDWTFTYDPAGRLTHETSPDGTYTRTYDAAAQLLTTTGPDGDRTCTHDSNGRRTTDDDRTYRWDAFGRLRAIETPTHTTALHHDTLGDLTAVNDLPLTWDSLHPTGRLITAGEHNLIGLHHPHAITSPHDHRPLASDWQHNLGTPGPDPYGGGAATAGLGYRGELAFDNLIWLRHRTYDPTTRNFLSPDPLPPVPATPYAANPYHYANNNPTDNIDPWGLRPLTDQDLAAQEDGGGFDWAGLGHGALDIIGLIPVIGEAADLANAAWYATEGDWLNAGLAVAAAIPIFGWAVTGGRWGVRGYQAVRSWDGARTWLTGRPPMVPRNATEQLFSANDKFSQGQVYTWKSKQISSTTGKSQEARFHAHGADPGRPTTENAGAGPVTGQVSLGVAS